MSEIEVTVLRGGMLVETVTRPLRELDGHPAITYKKQLHRVLEGNVVELDKRASPVRPAAVAAHRRNAPEEIPTKWDPAQLAVITESPGARLVVDAGPGTGKTAVACRRVAELISKHDLTPSKVWLISFTRTAVREIMTRIRAYLKDPAGAGEVRIATLDSHAWAIHSGFDDQAMLRGSYEENIDRVTDLVRQNDGVFEYLSRVEHLIIDEAQDIVGPRCHLILAIIERLDPACGVTVFADEAQAIYGFADEDGGSNAASTLLPQLLRDRPELGFRECVLTEIHRAETEGLLHLFDSVRKRVTSATPAGDERLVGVREGIQGSADRTMDRSAFDKVNATDSTFFLFRGRADALRQASMYGTRHHRLRMGGFPATVEPWLAVLLWDWTEVRLSADAFRERWADRIEGRDLATVTLDAAWQLLVRFAGEGRSVVSVRKLRERLARRGPPAEFCRPDFGPGGPVFGTIHGCKGREATTVLLMLPKASRAGKHTDPDEEARVLFVGATRAKSELIVIQESKSLYACNLIDGRTFTIMNRGDVSAQVEFGREGDVDAEGIAGRQIYADDQAVRAAQDWIAARASVITTVSAKADPALDYRYLVHAEGVACIAALTPRVNADLFEIGRQSLAFAGKHGKVRPDTKLRHLRMMGAGTLVLPPDAEHALLHEPWSRSGFMLTPLIVGFDMVYFHAYRS